MKKSIATLAVAAGLTGAATAGTKYAYTEQTVTTPPPLCFTSGELVVKPFYDMTIIDSAPHGHFDDDTLHGGGLAIDYFFTKALGLGIEGYWVDAPSVLHSYNVNLTARAPITDCLAVYAIGGGGVWTNGETVGSAHIGGGLEYRFTDTMGVFADGRYKWLDGDDITLTSVRIGLSFVF